MNALTEAEPRGDRKGFGLKRAAPLIALGTGAALFFGLGLHDYLTFDALKENRALLAGWVEGNVLLSAIAFIAIYAAGVVFLPPSGTLLTLAGGFVFGAAFGTVTVVFGATLGATVLFLIAKHSLGDWLQEKASPAIRHMEEGFQENELSYMLVLRLVPLFPFWLVNLAPAFIGVRTGHFVIGTFFGIIPGTAVYATVGAGLGSVFDRNEELTLTGVITPEILAGLIGLALLSLVPVAYKKWKARA